MKSISKILLGVASATALILMAAPAAHAQCGAPEPFGSGGAAMSACGVSGSPTCKIVKIDTTGVHNGGLEFGRFWVSGNSNNGNNFAGTCPSTNAGDPSSTWWDLCSTAASGCAATPLLRNVLGSIAAGTCSASTCPALDGSEQMTFLVEEWGPGGPPGIGGTAFWVGFRVDATPASQPRNWDLARPTGNPPVNATLPFLEFPTPQVTASSRVGPNVSTTNNFADLGPNFHSATGVSNTALLDSASIKAYDLCTFHGAGDPGRLRTSWTCTSGGASRTYTDAAVTGHNFIVPCQDILADTWYSVGITFSGGTGPDVLSRLVGRAVQVECDPTLAKPEPLPRPKVRPAPKGITPVRPGR